jgi:hypothetical protein
MLGTVLITACGDQNIAEDTTSYSIDQGDKRIISIFLEKNERLDLTVAVTDDRTIQPTIQEPMNIGISVVNPSGQYVVQYIRVGAGDFMVLAEEAGVYVITLDNSYSSFAPKSVTLTMKYPKR